MTELIQKLIDEKKFSEHPRPNRVCPIPRQPNNAISSTQKEFFLQKFSFFFQNKATM